MPLAERLLPQRILEWTDTRADRPLTSVITPMPASVEWTDPTGDRSGEVLDGWKAWLTRNNAAIMSVILLFFGVFLIGTNLKTVCVPDRSYRSAGPMSSVDTRVSTSDQAKPTDSATMRRVPGSTRTRNG